MMRSMLTNPQMRQSMMASNPQMRSLMERFPEAGDALGQPQVVEQALQMLDRIANSSQAEGAMSGQPGSFPAPGGGQTTPIQPPV